MHKLTPLGQLVLIKPVVAAAEQQGEIYLGASADKGLKRAEVVALGKKDMPDELKVGSVILTDYYGSEVKINDKKFYLLSIEHVLAIVE